MRTRTYKPCSVCGAQLYAAPGNTRAAFCSRACHLAHRRATSLETSPSRFWSFVQKTETCWLWTGGLNEKGYGSFKGFGVGRTKAHRASWFVRHGEWPGGLLLHSCGVSNCVNPDHLRIGDHRQNMVDMVTQGRSKLGETHPSSKLTTGDVFEIRRLRREGATLPVIATRFGVCEQTVSAIALGKSWRHLQSDAPPKLRPHEAATLVLRERGQACVTRVDDDLLMLILDRSGVRTKHPDPPFAVIRALARNPGSLVAGHTVAGNPPRRVRCFWLPEKKSA